MIDVVIELRRFRIPEETDVEVGARSRRRETMTIDQEPGDRAAETTGGDEARHVDGDTQPRGVFQAELFPEYGRPGDRRPRAPDESHGAGDDADLGIVTESFRDRDAGDVLNDDEDGSKGDQDQQRPPVGNQLRYAGA